MGMDTQRRDPHTGTTTAGTCTYGRSIQKFIRRRIRKTPASQQQERLRRPKTTTLPISKEIVLTYVLSEQKFPWFIDFLNINLNTTDLEEAKRRIGLYRERFVGGEGSGLRRIWILWGRGAIATVRSYAPRLQTRGDLTAAADRASGRPSRAQIGVSWIFYILLN